MVNPKSVGSRTSLRFSLAINITLTMKVMSIYWQSITLSWRTEANIPYSVTSPKLGHGCMLKVRSHDSHMIVIYIFMMLSFSVIDLQWISFSFQHLSTVVVICWSRVDLSQYFLIYSSNIIMSFRLKCKWYQLFTIWILYM